VLAKVGIILPDRVFIQTLSGWAEELEEDPKHYRSITDCHNHLTARHPGVKRMLELLVWRKIKWPGMWKNVKDYVKGCIVCQKSKPKTGKNANPLGAFLVAGAPWEIMSWDLIGPLPKSRTFNAIVTMVDTRTKAIKLEPANITISTMGAAVIMRNRVYWEEGLPSKVISDWGPQFVSKFIREFYRLLGIKGNPSMAYHPQMDGQTERVNQEVKKYLRMFVGHQQDNWMDWLPLAKFSYNNAVSESTRFSPFYLNKGWHPHTLQMDMLADASIPVEYYVDIIKKVSRKAEECLLKTKEQMTKQLSRTLSTRRTIFIFFCN
jgi:hypothetical protein